MAPTLTIDKYCLTSPSAMRVIQIGTDRPNATATEVAREMDIRVPLAYYHLSHLARLGVVIADRVGGRKEVYYTIARNKMITGDYPFGTVILQLN